MLEYADLARLTEVQNTIPSNYVDIAVTASAVTHDLNALGAVSLLGKRVRFRAVGGDITFLRGEHAGLTAGAGVLLTSGSTSERYFVAPEGAQLTVIASGAFTLRCFYDDD